MAAMKRSLLLSLVITLLTFSLGCGDDAENTAVTESAYAPPPDASTAAPAPSETRPAADPAADPCTLLTAAEVAAVLGTEVSQGMPTTTDTMTRCTWTPTRGDAGGVSVGLLTGNAESVFDGYRRTGGNIELTGLGDGAFYNEELQNLVVRRGERVLVIDFDRREEEVVSEAQDLARRILPKL